MESLLSSSLMNLLTFSANSMTLGSLFVQWLGLTILRHSSPSKFFWGTISLGTTLSILLGCLQDNPAVAVFNSFLLISSYPNLMSSKKTDLLKTPLQRIENRFTSSLFWLILTVGNIGLSLRLSYPTQLKEILIHGFCSYIGLSHLILAYFSRRSRKLPQRQDKLIFISVGEVSGDILGAALIEDLSRQNPHIKFIGIGGPLMRRQKFESLMFMEDFQYTGFKNVLLSLFKIFQQFFSIRKLILQRLPDIVIFIDLPDIHLNLEQNLKNSQFPGKIVHYVCPSIWAWRKNRKKTLEKNLDLLLTILPFEKNIFQNTNSPLKVEYVGHPLTEIISRHHFQSSWKEKCHIVKDSPFIALFPGSRFKDVKNNLHLQLLALKQSIHYRSHPIMISYADNKMLPLLKQLTKDLNIEDYCFVPATYKYEMMKDADLIIAKCGTIVLEAALMCKPTLTSCLLCPFDTFIARYIFQLGSGKYALPNLISDDEVFPEFIGGDLENLSKYLSRGIDLFHNPETKQICIDRCRKLLDIVRHAKDKVSPGSTILSLFKTDIKR